ncbi:hypothetical protein AArcSl_1101 [Halalkaliarchaeum desulfuricum]|uniref:Uncharacterized protein n=1 Tax=Halalkaliarchaeum desulfuricum TaxID=2055893 RepID=A0A343TI14_9EURY|nr:hypothetical protein [Halalkaliarchaeum desulfuricum]AUX08736.1 hypothetical protein AArcSl_1101 [Halalkaliarchaeum desulfuricum]
MDAKSAPTPRFGSDLEVDVTDWTAEELSRRSRDYRVRGSELYLERRGGRTYLVADPVPGR